jgi:hypothetical protein
MKEIRRGNHIIILLCTRITIPPVAIVNPAAGPERCYWAGVLLGLASEDHRTTPLVQRPVSQHWLHGRLRTSYAFLSTALIRRR